MNDELSRCRYRLAREQQMCDTLLGAYLTLLHRCGIDMDSDNWNPVHDYCLFRAASLENAER